MNTRRNNVARKSSMHMTAWGIIAAIGLVVDITGISIAQATVITVNTIIDELNIDGDCSLREAVQAANSNTAVDACPAGSGSVADEIIVPAGTYTLTIPPGPRVVDEDVTGDLNLNDIAGRAVTITGAGADTTIIQACAPVLPATTCTGIDRVFEVSNVEATITGVTIRNGTAPVGGGIVNRGRLTLTNSIVSGNTATLASGSIDSLGGGGIFNVNVLTLINSIVSGNMAPAGGGIANVQFGSVIITNSTLSGNTSRFGGGGIYNAFGSNFSDSTLTITNSTVSNNTVTQGHGGGIQSSGNSRVNVTVTNSTISGNTSSGGGGILLSGGSANLSNVTITNNRASVNSAAGGGGIAGNFVSRNTIIAGNFGPTSSPDCAGNSQLGTVVSQGYNLIGVNTADCISSAATGDQLGTSANPINPLLGPLADNGGLTQTHALLPGSPAINGGNPAGCTDNLGNLLTIDQRGVARPQGAGCDAGAFERAPVDNDDDGDGFTIAAGDCDDTDNAIFPGATEVCNSLDDNCDGTVDEGFPNLGTSCTVGTGTCQRTSAFVCTADGQGTQCGVTPGDPRGELCNALDDDCDGAVDESPTDPLQPLTQSCYSGPTGTAGVGTCQVGSRTCSNGTFGDCAGEVTPAIETCDTQDNDCDGTVDDGFNVGGSCSVGTGVCQSTGVLVCADGGQGTACNATPGMPGAEVCNGLDDNCDGTVDENNPGGGASCSTGLPGVCSVGALTCTNGGLSCQQSVQPARETCDGLDNDCDGTVDDGFDVGAACSVGVGACQNTGVQVCIASGSGTQCSATPGTPGIEVCGNDIDEDCDGVALTCPSPPPPSGDTCTPTTILDNFNRADGSVGSNWRGVTTTSFYRIAGNRLDVQVGGPLYWNPAAFGANQAAFMTLSTVDPRSPSQGVLLKVQSGDAPHAGAIAVVYDAAAKAVRVSTLRLGGLSWTPYGNTSVLFTNGDKLGACAKANGEVRVYKNDALVKTVTLNTADQGFFNPKGGKVGVWTVLAPQAFFDDFGGATIVP